jgi:DNA-binding CsgD family transcriptional regulator
LSEGACHSHLALLHAERGEDEQAAAHHERAREVLLGASDSQWLAGVYVAEATRSLWQGQPEQAVVAVADCLAAVEHVERPFMTARLYELGARAHADLAARSPGDEAERDQQLQAASVLMARLDSRLEATPGRPPSVLAALAGCAAEISRVTSSDAVALWAAAQQSWERLGDRYLAAYAQWRRAEASLARGDRGEARDLSRRAHETASALRAAPLAREIAAFARRARVQLDRATAGESSAPGIERLDLTARELEVLQLLAGGKTNREIAAELVISEKTASVHVSHILSKLGVRNRVEAASLAHALGVEAIT